jgi:hypothetical protein
MDYGHLLVMAVVAAILLAGAWANAIALIIANSH